MATMKAKYLGQLRVECEHVASGTKMMTDAPVDNCGKGEDFAPIRFVCCCFRFLYIDYHGDLCRSA